MSVKLGNTDIAGTQVLYSTTGSNTDGAMTQEATTTQLSLKANDADVVHKTGDETITGEKTFTHPIDSKITNITKGTTPTSNTFNALLWGFDKNNKAMGMIELGYLTDKTTKMTIGAFNGNTTDSADGGVYLELFNNNGTGYAKCPASDVNGSIVTTVNKYKSSNGYLQLGNGIIIQWGRFQNTNNNFSVTFPKSFSNTNYSVSVGQVDSQRSPDHNISINARNTTGFTGWISCHSTSLYSFWIAIGY